MPPESGTFPTDAWTIGSPSYNGSSSFVPMDLGEDNDDGSTTNTSVSSDITELSHPVDLTTNIEDIKINATLSWLDLTNIITKRRPNEIKQRVILDNISGIAVPGEMMAILGPSGAGKTTLLNILAGHISAGELTGSILFNGKKREDTFGSVSAYVEQDDIMIATQTVYETLKFAADLRLPSDMPKAKKSEKIAQTIQALGLARVITQRIGDANKRGVSGGERKRTSIAIELLTNPSLLFLDEPTSGLDSFNAYNVIELLKHLVQRGRTVIMTIHQPRANLLELFDKVLFLSQGQVCYFGPPDKIVEYFGALGYHCPTFTNPADFAIDLITVDVRTPELLENSERRVREICDFYRNQYNQQQKETAIEKSEQSKSDYEGTDAPPVRKYEANYFFEIVVITGRNWRNWKRAKDVTLVEIMQAVILGLLVGAIFFGSEDDQAGVQNRLGALFFITLNLVFISVLPKLNMLIEEYTVFRRERSSNTYRVLPYLLARMAIDLISILIYPIILVGISYFMVGLMPTAKAFFTLLVVLWSIMLCARLFGLAVSSITGSVAVAQVVAILILLLFVLFGGFYANSSTYWGGIAWIQHISFVNYAFKAVVQNEFQGQTLECSGPICAFQTGDDVIAFYRADTVNIWICVVAILAFALLYGILAYLALKWRTRVQNATI